MTDQEIEAIEEQYCHYEDGECSFDSKGFARALLAKAVPKWLPIETAPKDGTWFYVMWDDMDYSDGFPQVSCWHKNALFDVESGDYHDVDAMPTHWMPLPAAPSPNEEKE